MTRWLLRGADLVATFDDAGTELPGGDVLVDGDVIEAVGTGLSADGCDRVVDGSGLVVLPGLVNAHQHLYQGGVRARPELERALIGPWLRALGGIVKGWWQAGDFGPDAVQAIAAAVLTESLLGGVTTVADQHYFHPAGATLPYVEATIAAAGEVGVRLHACRGTITDGPDPDVVQSIDEVLRHCAELIATHHDPSPGSMVQVALAPCGVHVDHLDLFDELAALAADHDGVRLHACRGTITDGPDPDVVQSIDEVLRHCAELIATHHDPAPGSMVQVALAPCGVHVDHLDLFDELAALAADHDGVRLHTHLYEHVDTEAAFRRYGKSPWELLVEHGWAQDRTWLAHVVDVPLTELPDMAAAGVAVAHLPAPDLKMGWGSAPFRHFLDAGITVGMGTTGSSSNDGSDLLGDLRLAALAHRTGEPDPERWPTARELLRAATRGSAACLGRDDLGSIEPGQRADLSAWDLRTVDRVGVHDPLAGLVLTGLSNHASLVAVGGQVLVEGGEPTFDVAAIAARAREAVPCA